MRWKDGAFYLFVLVLGMWFGAWLKGEVTRAPGAWYYKVTTYTFGGKPHRTAPPIVQCIVTDTQSFCEVERDDR
jgi:hypothetical protein